VTAGSSPATLPSQSGAGGPTQSRSGAPPLRGNRDFRLLWIGQASSEVGSAVSALALSLLVLAVTGSASLTGLTGTLIFGTSWIMQLPAGYVTDRYSRRKIMLFCDGIRGASQLVLAVAILTHAIRISLILALVVVSTAAWTFFGPAQIRAIRTIIDRNQIVEATALNMARGYAADLAGPLLSGVLFTLGHAIPFLTDAASFGISAVSVTRIRSDLGTGGQTRAKQSVLAGIREGWRYVWRHPFLRSLMFYSAGSNFVATALIFAIILVAGNHVASGTPIGAALTVATAGGVLGAAIAPKVQRLLTIRRILLLTGIFRIIVIASFTLTRQPVILGALLAIFIMLSPTASTALAAKRTQIVPPEILGKATTSTSFVSTALQPLAPLAIGLMLTHLGQRTAVLVLASLMVLVTLYVLRTAGFSGSVTEAPDSSELPFSPPAAMTDDKSADEHSGDHLRPPVQRPRRCRRRVGRDLPDSPGS
jgi:MFS family permease